MTISAVVVAYRAGGELLSCLRSLIAQRSTIELIIVDNGSNEVSLHEARAEFPTLEVFRPRTNLGFAEGANQGATRASGELLLFLNPDVVLNQGCLDRLLREFDNGSVAVVAPSLHVAASGTTEFGATLDPLGFPVPLLAPGRPLYVPGCALMTRGTLFRRLGGFDGRFFMFAEDADYCVRALLSGWDVRVAADASALHAGGGSAPGGYIKHGRLETTTFRVALRERNTLAMIIKCVSFPALSLIVPLYVAQSLATVGLLGACGDVATARAILGGLLWNASEARATVVARKTVQRQRVVSDRVLLKRMHRGLRKLELLRRYGRPTVWTAP